jgi:hypothetical protein
MRKLIFTAALASFVLASPATARKKEEIGGLALQQMQARDYEVGKSVSFPAVMTVLQDSGYRIASADRDTGLITASASTNSKMSYNLFVGFGRSKKTPVVSVFVEDRGVGSRVRLNFVMAKTKSSLYGMSSSDEEPITDPLVYQNAFEKVEKEIFVRQSLNAGVPVAHVSPVPVTPAIAH